MVVQICIGAGVEIVFVFTISGCLDEATPGLLTDVVGTSCVAVFDDVMVVIGFIAVTVDVGGGAGFVNDANGAGDGFSFVSDTDGFVDVKLLTVDVIADVGGNVDGGGDFVGDSKVTQGSRFSNFEFFICSDK